MSLPPLFLYGTLRDQGVLRAVLGRAVAEAELVPATLPGHAARSVVPGGWPVIVPAPGAQAPGLLFDPADGAERARLDFYELGYGYVLRAVMARGPDGARVAALAYFPPSDGIATDGPWHLDDWQARDAGVAAEAAVEVMSFLGVEAAATVARRYPQMLVRAQSRLAARAAPRPQRLHSGGERSAIVERGARRPYARFFSVEERDLLVPGFDGGQVRQDNRAALVATDAVMVLPYDPRRDRVLVVEQFRLGPYLRNDPHPWTLEPVAGRRDAGESPEDTARREALEEAGVRLGRLEKIAEYYPSPGCLAEYHICYLGLADLPQAGAATHGVAAEAEDIRAHVLPFVDLLAAVDSGEVETGPLLLALHWLARNRARLRATETGTGPGA